MNNETIKAPGSPLDLLYQFLNGLHDMERIPLMQNYSIRGQFISIYLPIDQKLHFENYLHSQNRLEYGFTDYVVERYPGYSKKDTYFRLADYIFRIAVYKEKHQNSNDLNYQRDQYERQLAELRRERDALKKVIDTYETEHLKGTS